MEDARWNREAWEFLKDYQRRLMFDLVRPPFGLASVPAG
jgi:hypothetical protein